VLLMDVYLRRLDLWWSLTTEIFVFIMIRF